MHGSFHSFAETTTSIILFIFKEIAESLSSRLLTTLNVLLDQDDIHSNASGHFTASRKRILYMLRGGRIAYHFITKVTFHFSLL